MQRHLWHWSGTKMIFQTTNPQLKGATFIYIHCLYLQKPIEMLSWNHQQFLQYFLENMETSAKPSKFCNFKWVLLNIPSFWCCVHMQKLNHHTGIVEELFNDVNHVKNRHFFDCHLKKKLISLSLCEKKQNTFKNSNVIIKIQADELSVIKCCSLNMTTNLKHLWSRIC